MKIVFFGDSFLQCKGLRADEAWPALVDGSLQKLFWSPGAMDNSGDCGGDVLRRALDLNGGRLLPIDTEISSAIAETTRGALARMQADLLEKRPNIAVIQYSSNDSTHLYSMRGAPLVSQDAFRANLIEMVDRCRRFDIQRVVFLTTHPVAKKRFDIHGLSPDETTGVYDNIVREVAAATTQRVADVRLASESWPAPEELCLDDQLHVNAEGARLYAGVVTPVLADVVLSILEMENHPKRRAENEGRLGRS